MHRVVDGQRRNHVATRTVQVEVDVFAAVLALQIQQLHHDFVGIARVDLALQKHNAIFQQQVTQSQLTLTLITLRCIRVFNFSRRNIAEKILTEQSVIEPRIQRALLLVVQGKAIFEPRNDSHSTMLANCLVLASPLRAQTIVCEEKWLNEVKLGCSTGTQFFDRYRPAKNYGTKR